MFAKLFALVPPEALVALISAVLAGVIIPLVFKHLRRQDQERVLAATKGLYAVISAIATRTDTPFDNLLAQLVDKVAEEMGRNLSPAEVARVKNIALALHIDPTRPSLGAPTAIELARAINIPVAKQ